MYDFQELGWCLRGKDLGEGWLSLQNTGHDGLREWQQNRVLIETCNSCLYTICSSWCASIQIIYSSEINSLFDKKNKDYLIWFLYDNCGYLNNWQSAFTNKHSNIENILRKHTFNPGVEKDLFLHIKLAMSILSFFQRCIINYPGDGVNCVSYFLNVHHCWYILALYLIIKVQRMTFIWFVPRQNYLGQVNSLYLPLCCLRLIWNILMMHFGTHLRVLIGSYLMNIKIRGV